MYIYVKGRKFPIERTYGGKGKIKSDAQTGDNMRSDEIIGKEQQNPQEVPPKTALGVPPKNEPKADDSQHFNKDSNSESTTQSNGESTTQTEDDLISNDGWIPLFRKLLDSQVFASEGLLKVWIWCLLKASHAEQWVPMKTGKGKTQVHILPGQFIFGRKKAAKELKMHPETVRKRINKLKNMQNLTTQSHNHYSLITLTSWEFHRELQRKGIGKVPGKYQPSTTYKNVNKEKPYSLTSIEVQLSELLLNLILERRNGFKRPDLQRWAKYIDLMIRIDEREPEEIEKVIKWCQGDEFWQNNILSTGKLRKQYDQLAMKMGEQTDEIRWDEKHY